MAKGDCHRHLVCWTLPRAAAAKVNGMGHWSMTQQVLNWLYPVALSGLTGR
jgi:hypothetical protein